MGAVRDDGVKAGINEVRRVRLSWAQAICGLRRVRHRVLRWSVIDLWEWTQGAAMQVGDPVRKALRSKEKRLRPRVVAHIRVTGSVEGAPPKTDGVVHPGALVICQNAVGLGLGELDPQDRLEVFA